MQHELNLVWIACKFHIREDHNVEFTSYLGSLCLLASLAQDKKKKAL